MEIMHWSQGKQTQHIDKTTVDEYLAFHSPECFDIVLCFREARGPHKGNPQKEGHARRSRSAEA